MSYLRKFPNFKVGDKIILTSDSFNDFEKRVGKDHASRTLERISLDKEYELKNFDGSYFSFTDDNGLTGILDAAHHNSPTCSGPYFEVR